MHQKGILKCAVMHDTIIYAGIILKNLGYQKNPIKSAFISVHLANWAHVIDRR